MEMHQLRYFLKAAEHLNFTRAAEDCLISQPSLSQQIMKLEQELGQQLFERLGRTVRLTEAGRLLRHRAEQIVTLADAAKSELADDGQTGRIVVAAIPTIAPYFLPPVLRKFARRFPKSRVEVYEEVTETLLKLCASGEVDVGVLALPVRGDGLQVEPLFDEELLLVLPASHALTKKKRITLADVDTEPFVLLNEAHCLSEQVSTFCRQGAFQPIATGRTNQLSTVQELVALGQGISLIPEMARRQDKSKQRVYRSISGQKPKRTVALVWNRNRFQSRLVRQFIETVRNSPRPAFTAT